MNHRADCKHAVVARQTGAGLVAWAAAHRCLVLLLVASTVASLALPGGLSSAIAAPPAKSAAAPNKKAEAIAEEGKRRFREGEYAIALGLFQKALELDGRADRMYNIARCHEKLGNLDEAVRLFRGYAEATSDVGGKEEALVRAAELEKRSVAQKAHAARDTAAAERAKAKELAAPATPTAAAVEAPVAAPAPPTPTVDAPPLVGVVVAGSVAALGGVLLVVGLVQDGSLQGDLSRKNPQGHVTGTTEVQAYARRDSTSLLQASGVVLGSVGVVGAAVAWWLRQTRPGAPVPTSDGRSVGLLWRF